MSWPGRNQPPIPQGVTAPITVTMRLESVRNSGSGWYAAFSATSSDTFLDRSISFPIEEETLAQLRVGAKYVFTLTEKQ